MRFAAHHPSNSFNAEWSKRSRLARAILWAKNSESQPRYVPIDSGLSAGFTLCHLSSRHTNEVMAATTCDCSASFKSL